MIGQSGFFCKSFWGKIIGDSFVVYAFDLDMALSYHLFKTGIGNA